MSIVEKALGKLSRARSLATAPPLSRRSGGEPEPALPRLDPGPAIVAARSGKRIRVDLEMLRVAGALPPAEHDNRIRDEFRRIKRFLLSTAGQRAGQGRPPGQVIALTSATPAEGKTFSSVNLALGIASEPDHTVVLVDADIPKSNVSRLFGLQQEVGLTDLLARQDMRPEDVIVATDIPGLSILPAGHRVENAAELLASSKMQALVDRLAQQPSCIVLIDTPPLLATSEALAIVPQAGQTVLVVHAEVTRQRVVAEALQLLNGAHNVSLLLNRSRHRLGADYYYDYPGGDYGQQDNQPNA
jgi:protein-tyrosine kinase